MTALITTASSPKALVAIRSLGRKGIPVDTADKQSFSLGSLSKYSKKSFIYPSPKESPEEFISTLVSIIKDRKQDVLIPVHSEDTYLIAKYKSKLEPLIKVPLHEYSIISRVNDKGYLMKVADDLGLPVPQTYYPQSLSELYDIADKLSYPAVIKLIDTSSSIGLSYVYSKAELISKYENTVMRFNLSTPYLPIIQEFIKGTGCGVSLLFNHGNLRAKFVHKRLREYPITGGPATCRISIKHPPMEKIAIDLLKHFNWHGLAMVEFKLSSDNIPVLMEINPRIWGSINQAVQSGVDFPYLLYRMALDGDIMPVVDYKVGVKTKNIFIDYLAIYNYLKKYGRKGLLKGFFSLPRNDDILSLEDPLPILGFIRSGLKELMHSRYL